MSFLQTSGYYSKNLRLSEWRLFKLSSMAMEENIFNSIYSIYKIIIAPHQHSAALMDSIKYLLGSSINRRNDGISKFQFVKHKNTIIRDNFSNVNGAKLQQTFRIRMKHSCWNSILIQSLNKMLLGYSIDATTEWMNIPNNLNQSRWSHQRHNDRPIFKHLVWFQMFEFIQTNDFPIAQLLFDHWFDSLDIILITLRNAYDKIISAKVIYSFFLNSEISFTLLFNKIIFVHFS